MFLDSPTIRCFPTVHNFFFQGSRWYLQSHKRQLCLYCAPDNLVLTCALYIEVYVIDNTWCEYQSNQTNKYAVNLGLTCKTPIYNGCFKIVAYTEQQQTAGHDDNSYNQFQ